MTINYLLRSAGTGHSIETVFDTLQRELSRSSDVTVNRIQMPYISKGLRSIWQNLRFAARLPRNGLFHVTGDVHYVALALPKAHTVLTIHDCIALKNNRKNPLRYAIFWLLWYYLPIRRSAVVTTISEKTRQELIQLIGNVAQKIVVIPNAIQKTFTYQPRSFCAAQPVLLQIGTAPHKNLLRLIDALENKLCKLVLVGQLSEVITNQLQLRQITYEHYQNLSHPQIIRLYAACDIVCFVSLYEGFGMPILEAQAIGRPVLVSRISPLTEVGGEAACYVNPTDVVSIRAGIERLCGDEAYRAKLIRLGRENVVRFTSEKIVADYRTLYDRLS
ncbi:glycosyltransferase family 1 protein [Spirosoma daeguense]